jgi:dihydrofolate synthase/folylpolyglutamate synthase
MRYKETLQFLYDSLPMFHRVGPPAYKADLNNTIALCKALGDPQHAFPSVHIAGTNGKGSVSHLCAAILQSAGYRTGLFTSPHLKDFRERIRINGVKMHPAGVSSFVAGNKTIIDDIQPSFFEMTFAMAARHFADKRVDVAVIETGMGGRLDSTNLVSPVVTAITNIGHDHMQFLGDTLPGVASEKAGIFKAGVPAVIGERHEAVEGVFRARAASLGCSLTFAEDTFGVIKTTSNTEDPGILAVDILENARPRLKAVACPLPGNYQLKNIATVMEIVRVLRKLGWNITDAHCREGISQVVRLTGLQGRWQVLRRHPLTICDCGHNEEGLRETTAQIALTPHKRLHCVFGMVTDKDAGTILRLLPEEGRYYFCRADIPRGLDAEVLARLAAEAGLSGGAYPSVKAAFAAARKEAGKDDLVFIGGSTFVVAEVL